jgi:pimeloyl-ACP methyl ester carboxylesterase
MLHSLSSPEHDTAGDLLPYLDRPLDVLFPAPPPLERVEERSTLLSRAFATRTLAWPSAQRVICPRYQTRHEGEYHRNLTAWARWLVPDGELREDCLVYIHGWLEPGSWIEEAAIFPGWVRKLDVDIVHVSLPFHGPRKPRRSRFSGELFWTADLVRTVEGVRQAICDTRSVCGWLRRRGYRTVGVGGISLGGSLAMLTACLDPVPDYVVSIVGHLKLVEAVENAGILWSMKRDLSRWGITEERRRDVFQRLGLDRGPPLLPPERQLWIAAREDAHIDPALVRRQWSEWGEPRLAWIPGGHMTFPTKMSKITKEMSALIDTVRARTGHERIGAL